MAQDAPTSEPPTKQERVDFLKQIIAFTESNVRSFDTKAQISLAAFVLSANPLVAISNSACSQGGGRSVLMVLVPTYIASILTYFWVLWPVAPPIAELTKNLALQNIFFIHDPVALGPDAFTKRLGHLSTEPELTAEALKLAYIRKIKGFRFKVAIIATVATYSSVALSFFLLGRCF